MPSNDFGYLRQRALEERQRAGEAASPEARTAHLSMSEHYEAAAARLRDLDEVKSSTEAIRDSLGPLRATGDQV